MGDPTLAGWTATLLYGVACWLCTKKGAIVRSFTAHDRRIWAVLVLFTASLGINKQLDFQTSVINLARRVLHALSLDEYKKVVGLLVLASAALVLFGVVVAWIYYFRRTHRDTRLALIGSGIVLFYTILRAAQFAHIRRGRVTPETWDIAIELLGLVILIWAARPSSTPDRISGNRVHVKVLREK